MIVFIYAIPSRMALKSTVSRAQTSTLWAPGELYLSLSLSLVVGEVHFRSSRETTFEKPAHDDIHSVVKMSLSVPTRKEPSKERKKENDRTEIVVLLMTIVAKTERKIQFWKMQPCGSTHCQITTVHPLS